MDSFSEPYTREGDDVSIDRVHAKIAQLEEEHRKNGIPLSGRIIHVVHSLPITVTYESSKHRSGAPPTPPPEVQDAGKEAQESSETKSASPWNLAPRYGHAAMISGIMSLSATHEQIIVGWTGDIMNPSAAANTSAGNPSTDRIPSASLSPQDKDLLEAEIKHFQPKDGDPDLDKSVGKTTYIPVWLDDKVAHGHYDGYCKQSTRFTLILHASVLTSSIVALWPMFHYLLWQDVATEYASADQHYPQYEAANAAFARRIVELYQPGDLIWVHDYHLLLLPRCVLVSVPSLPTLSNGRSYLITTLTFILQIGSRLDTGCCAWFVHAYTVPYERTLPLPSS